MKRSTCQTYFERVKGNSKVGTYFERVELARSSGAAPLAEIATPRSPNVGREFVLVAVSR